LCEHTFVSLSALNRALRDKDAERALTIARSVDHVPLRFAVRIVALLADGKHPLYKPASRRFLVRVIEEIEEERAPLVQVKKLADVLAHMHHPYYQHAARLALQEVVGQMHQREVRIALEFEADP
jgi:hypothetical protein